MRHNRVGWLRKKMMLAVTLLLLLQTAVPDSGFAAGGVNVTGAGTSPGTSDRSGMPSWTDAVPDWAQREVAELAEAGIFAGYEDGAFGAAKTITRAEIAVVSSRLADVLGIEPSDQTLSFTDVTDQWFADEVRHAARLGIVAGEPGGLFRPLAPVKRQEAAVMLGNLMKQDAQHAPSFRDRDAIPAWAASSVAKLQEAEVLTGYEDGTFGGTRELTRAEAAVIVHRTWQVLKPASATSFAVTAKAADGTLMKDAEIAIHAAGKRAYLLRGLTDGNGVYHAKLPFGSYDVYAVGAGAVGYVQVVFSKENASAQVITRQAAVLEGTIVDSNGAPAAGVVAAFTTNPTFYAVTGTDGSYSAYVLPEKTYRLSLIDDPRIRELVKKSGKPELALSSAERSAVSVALLDSGESASVDCGCTKADVTGTFTAPKAGERLGIGTILASGAAYAPNAGGGTSTGGGPVRDVIPPAVPTGLTAEPEERAVRLGWTANSESDLAGYKVYASTDSGVSWDSGTATGKVTGYTVSGLTNGVTYTFALTAYDTNGNESGRSQPVNAVPGNQGEDLPPDDPSKTAEPVPFSGFPSFHSTVDFLYTGDNPIQTGVAPGAIQEESAAVLRGKVTDKQGSALSGVAISVLNEERWGQTLSRSDGRFDMVVGGGALLTVKYEKAGYMTVQRQISTIPGDYNVLDDVVLTAYDTKVTTLDLQHANGPQVAQGSPVTDELGTRQSTVFVPKGTEAVMKLPDGTEVPLPGMHFRSTEYTVGENGPKAMPGELPSFVGYTYAVELSADEAIAAGATEVRFNQPVYHYVDNFLNFHVGETVPIGYYDRSLGQWIPSDNGRIIGITDIASGLAMVDIDGNGEADSDDAMLAIGLDEEERRELAKLYAPGKSLWRVPIPHFTPWDCNWPYGPPPDAEPPIDKGPNANIPEQEEGPCEQAGSIIGCQNQSLGERIPIAGTPYTLNYRSDRTPGYKERSRLEIPISGDSIPASMLGMRLQVAIAGKLIEKNFPAAANVTYLFDWDGKDAYNRQLVGSHNYTVTVSYQYGLNYYSSSSEFDRSFGRVATASIIGQRGATTISLTREWRGKLESPSNPFAEAGIAGWSLDPQRVYDPNSQVLYMGDGTKQQHMSAAYTEMNYYGNPGVPGSVVLGPEYQVEFPDMGEGQDRSIYIGFNKSLTRYFFKRAGMAR